MPTEDESVFDLTVWGYRHHVQFHALERMRRHTTNATADHGTDRELLTQADVLICSMADMLVAQQTSNTGSMRDVQLT